jgi:ribonuclease HI
LGYFDGASQGHPPKCGVGVVLYFNNSHYLFIRYAPGHGSNKKFEFISLWTLLETKKSKDVRKLQVMGDSKLVIDWVRQKNEVQDLTLATLMRDIRLDSYYFEWLDFHHIPREINEKANALSKEALLLPSGAFGVYKYFDGVETKAMKFLF